MAYNKASEERKWRLWKEAEEKQLRELGVSEDRIAQLRAYDWEIFNSDRRYYVDDGVVVKIGFMNTRETIDDRLEGYARSQVSKG